jgi:putative transcriptional regulator
MSIRLRLREILEERQIAQTELQALTGLGYSSINAMYHNKIRRVDFSTLNALCAALNIQPGEILQYVPEQIRGGRSVRASFRPTKRAG